MRAILIAMMLLPASALASFSFDRTYVDVNYGGNGKPGWVRAGDVDGDGDIDLVAGGGRVLYVYENDGDAGGWTRHGNLDPTGNIGANGAVLMDVDGDGDLDVVSAKFYDDLGWWENPCGVSCSLAGQNPWTFHMLGEVGINGSSGPHYYLHDMMALDFGGGVQVLAPGISNSCGSIAIKWFEPGTDPTQPWDEYVIEDGRGASSDGSCNHAGIDTGDVDADGHVDIAFSNGWYEAPADPRTTWPGAAWHPVTSYDNISDSLLRDIDGDDRLDLVTASGHYDGMHDVRWYANPGGDATGTWSHTVVASLRSPECLQARDLDGDDDIDLVSCDLDFGHWSDEIHNIYVLENQGAGAAWTSHPVAPDSYPSHKLQLVEVNADGKPDIISESAGYSVVSYYQNTSDGQGGCSFGFALEVMDASYPGNTRPGWSAAADIDGDGDIDGLAGGGQAIQWYQAPGWTRHSLETNSTAGGNGGVALDVDGDGDPDVVAALYNDDLVWWENPDGGSTGTWARSSVDDQISSFNHDLVLGDVDADGRPEAVALYVGGGVFWYDVPVDPGAGPWPRTRILASTVDPYVGLAVSDLDGDDDADVVVSNRWYERPADPATPDWTGRDLFADAVQNVTIHDVNGDGRPDVAAAEGFNHPDGRVLWAEAPMDPRTQPWTVRVVATGLDGPENIWAGDLDGDGDADLVSGEMGTSTGWNDQDSTLIVFENLDGDGTDWRLHVVASGVGVSARIQPVDVDSDGDVDFTADGNAEDHIYLWRNTTDCGDDVPPAAPTGLTVQ